MTCAHCDQPIEKNTVKGGPYPRPTQDYKHTKDKLMACFGDEGQWLGTHAEPKEEK